MVLLLCALSCFILAQDANASNVTVVRFDPAMVALNLGDTFTVSARIDDVADLYGFVFEIEWNTTLLDYVDHVAKVPVERYSDGVLHGPVLVVRDTVNATGGTYMLGVSSLSPAVSFYGSGIVFEISFRATYQPIEHETSVVSSVVFMMDDLVSTCACAIPHYTYDCEVTIFCFHSADVNHDWRIDLQDIVMCASSYGATSHDSHWNPDCDLAEPFGIIDLLDVVTVASHYGEVL